MVKTKTNTLKKIFKHRKGRKLWVDHEKEFYTGMSRN